MLATSLSLEACLWAVLRRPQLHIDTTSLNTGQLPLIRACINVASGLMQVHSKLSWFDVIKTLPRAEPNPELSEARGNLNFSTGFEATSPEIESGQMSYPLKSWQSRSGSLQRPLAIKGPEPQNEAVQHLESTVAKFQAALTEDDRKKLQSLKTSANDAQSIIIFTAELDASDPKRRGKSIAARLSSLLEIIQKFTPVVDTFVSSNPEMAALIWGAVKMTFLLLANFTSYFESFVELLYGFGSLCSRFTEYQVLFATSGRLKDSICEFHTAVITCCERLVLTLRRPLRSQVWKALKQSFQAELRTYVEDIRAKAENVQESIRLAKAQSDRYEQEQQSKERQEAAAARNQLTSWISLSRKQLRGMSEENRRRAAEQKWQRLLNDLSSYNYSTAFGNARNKRHVGTAEWIFSSQEFQHWYNDHQSAVLHITGKIGSGKSILTSRVIEYLLQNRNPRQFVSFCFLRFDDHASLECDTIIRSLARQMLCTFSMDTMDPGLSTTLLDCLEQIKANHFSHETLETLFRYASSLLDEWFIILDGIDECVPTERRSLFHFISSLMGHSGLSAKLKILYSGRETANEDISRSFSAASTLVTGSMDTREDILKYAADIVEAKVSVNELVVGDPCLIEEVLDTIATKEQGMFLWAFLTIEDICARKTDHDIRKALLDVPADLPATFDRALGRIVQRNNQEIAKAIFKWAAVVRQPLTLSQMREALSVEIGQTSIQPERLINGIERLTLWCENLVQVEDGDSTIHFCHHSVQEFLCKPDAGPFKDFHFGWDEADHYAGEICLTYLCFNTFKAVLVERPKDTVQQFPSPSAGGIAQHTLQAAIPGNIGARVGRLVNRYVSRSSSRSRSSRTRPGNVILHDPPASQATSPVVTSYSLLEYLTKHWLSHPRSFQDTRKTTWELIRRMLTEPQVFVETPWMDLNLREDLSANGPGPAHTMDLATLVESPLTALQFALMYAVKMENHTLICRTFLLLTEIADETLLAACFKFIADNGHVDCHNRCINKVHQQISHWTMVDCVTKLIAKGITSWAPSKSEARHGCICPEATRKSGVHADISQVLISGYDASAQPFLQTFAQIATADRSSPILEASYLPPDHLINARTVTGKNFVDLAAEWMPPLSSTWQSDNDQGLNPGSDLSIILIGNLLGYNHQSSDATKKRQMTGALKHNLETGKFNTTDAIIDYYPGTGQPDASDVAALCKATQYFWPERLLDRICRIYQLFNTFNSKVFEAAVLAENWQFARIIKGPSIPRGKRIHSTPKGFWTMLLHCEACRFRIKYPAEGAKVDPSKTTDLLKGVHLCDECQRGSRANYERFAIDHPEDPYLKLLYKLLEAKNERQILSETDP
ncbi:Fc.00g027030.m01.CDS01 [Cosmosporella sp. VM-42]